MSAHDPATVVGAIGERGLLKHAAEDPTLLDAEIVEVMEPPFPAVSSRRSGARRGRAARRRSAGAARHARRPRRGTRHAHGFAGSIGFVSEHRAAARRVRDPRRARRADARPDVRLGDPGDPPDLDLRPARARRVRRRLRLRALGQPDAGRARAGARRARGRPGGRVLLRPGRRARADHRRVRGRLARRPAGRSVRRHLPAGRQGAEPLGPRVRPRRPDRPRRARAGRAATTRG